MTPPPGSPPALRAAAASSSIAEYRPNGAGSPTVRTLEALLGWAAGRGVTAPDWIEVRVAAAGAEPEVDGRPVPALYLKLYVADADEAVVWRSPPWLPRSRRPASVIEEGRERVLVRVRSSVLDRDEQFLHVLAHEVYEVTRLREEFEACGGRLTAAAVHELTRAERGLNNLHAEAWDHADAVLRAFRAATDPAGDSS